MRTLKDELDKVASHNAHHLDQIRTALGVALAPEFIFRAAGIHETMHHTDEALVLYDRVGKDYPQWENRVVLLFKKAVMLHNEGRLGEARTAYMEVIASYPDHKFAKDARVLVESMGTGQQDWIKNAQEKEDDPDAGSGI